MTKSATELMQDIIFSSIIDGVAALKGASKGMPNTLLRDLNAIHANSTFADLPEDLQKAITASARSAFNTLRKEGYTVAPGADVIRRPTAQPRRPTRAHKRVPNRNE